MFIAFDGIDGAGKSTQLERFCQWLRGEERRDVVRCRDPGGTPLGDQLRALLLERADLNIHSAAETLIYMASRAQLVEEVIRPALAAGKTVVSDRFLLSNVAYQGYGRRLGAESIWELGRRATGDLLPDLTFVLDLDPTVAAQRMTDRPDRMEAEGIEFQRRVREGFLEEARRRPEAIRVIDAGGSVDAIQGELRREVAAVWAAAPREAT